MLRMLWIEIAGAVRSVDSPSDHAHIALSFVISLFGFSWTAGRGSIRLRRRGRGSGEAFLLQLFLFSEILGASAINKRYRITIRRPLWLSCSARNCRKLKGVATSHCQHEELRYVRSSILFGDANKNEVFAVWRPTRR
jgi:hypothetical protein